MGQLERFLGHPDRLSLWRLIWTADIVKALKPSSPLEWVEVGVVHNWVPDRIRATRRTFGMKKIVLRKADDVGSGET